MKKNEKQGRAAREAREKRTATAPVCPYARSYEEVRTSRRGRQPKSPEALREQIDSAIDRMFEAQDFWTLETLRAALMRLVLFDEAAAQYGNILLDLNDATENQLVCLQRFSSVYVHPPRASKRRGNA